MGQITYIIRLVGRSFIKRQAPQTNCRQHEEGDKKFNLSLWRRRKTILNILSLELLFSSAIQVCKLLALSKGRQQTQHKALHLVFAKKLFVSYFPILAIQLPFHVYLLCIISYQFTAASSTPLEVDNSYQSLEWQIVVSIGGRSTLVIQYAMVRFLVCTDRLTLIWETNWLKPEINRLNSLQGIDKEIEVLFTINSKSSLTRCKAW